MKTWNERLKSRFADLKRSEGMTQSKLAERLGVAQGAVANWMSGRRSPADLSEFEKIADSLGVTVAWLMHGEEERKEEPELRELCSIPILKPNQVSDWYENRAKVDSSSNRTVRWMSPTSFDKSRVYAIEATDSGMEPAICPGDIIVIYPSHDPLPGRLIALDFHGNGHLTIGKMSTKGSSLRLALSDELIDLDDSYTEMYRGRVLAIMVGPDIYP